MYTELLQEMGTLKRNGKQNDIKMIGKRDVQEDP
jgi:hypothetical protein